MDQEAFVWKQHAEAEQYLLTHLEDYCARNQFLNHLADRLERNTSTRLLDWTDHIGLVHDSSEEKTLERLGFTVEEQCDGYLIYAHPGAQLPRVILHDPAKFRLHGLSVRVDSISDFLKVRGFSCNIEGSPFSAYRRCSVATEKGITLWVEERRGTRTIEPVHQNNGYVERYFYARERWATRPRHWSDEEEGIKQAQVRANEMVALLGADMAAHMVLEVEREYWQTRNRAAEIQKARQDRLGMGWANHDHHTFRSSRRHFTALVALFETLGFHCRERFYAGKEAGWGAQVMENPTAGAVLFLDVDLSPDEVSVDFAHEPLEERDALGTIGLWCALHGDSILQAGMHHLEGQFYFDNLKEDLAGYNIEMMEPFSDFPHLKQAFTSGERWAVASHRIRDLLNRRLIDEAQAKTFREEGAIGSHLENLQRRNGFKGFNQQNVSYIIKQTDPRLASETSTQDLRGV